MRFRVRGEELVRSVGVVTVARQDFGRNHMRLKDCSCTYSVVRAHDAACVSSLNCALERPEVVVRQHVRVHPKRLICILIRELYFEAEK